MERVVCGRAVRRWVGQSINDLQLLDDRSWPSVIDDEWQCVFVLGPNMMKWMSRPSISVTNRGSELRFASTAASRSPSSSSGRDSGSERAVRPGTGPRQSPSLATVWRRSVDESSDRFIGDVDVEGADVDGRLEPRWS